MRINAHTHGAHGEREADGRIIPPLVPIWKHLKLTPDEVIAYNRQLDTERVILLDPPDITFAALRDFGDFVIPVPQIDLDKDSPEVIEELFRQGAKGIKFVAPAYSYGDDRYFKHYQAVYDNGGLAVFHTGYLITGSFEPGGHLGREQYTDITLMRPAALDRVARALPKLNILMAHFGNPWWEEAWKILSSHKNIYADFSGGTAYRRDMQMWKWIFAPNGILDTNAVSRLCYGTDGCAFDLGNTETNIINFYEQFYEMLKLPQELRERIDSGNIKQLIK